MITTDVVDDRIELRAYGRLTLADLKYFELASSPALALNRQPDLMLDLRNMEGASLDALMEEWKFAQQHGTDFRRIAVVSQDQFVNWGACLSQLFVDVEIASFDDEDTAYAWLAEPRKH